MRKLLAVLALLLAGSGVVGQSVWADSYLRVQDGATAGPRMTVTVFNDQGAALTSGNVVVWDSADTDFSTTMYPYVILSTTVDDPWTAGVVLSGTIPDQQLGEIVIFGPAPTLCADSSDAIAVNTLVATSATSGQCGDFAPGANLCSLGMAMQDTGGASNGEINNVFVDVTCQ